MPKVKIPPRVAVADVLDHCADQIEIAWYESLLDLCPQEIAEKAAEILMPRVGKETP
jgi:hypothetical protein